MQRVSQRRNFLLCSEKIERRHQDKYRRRRRKESELKNDAPGGGGGGGTRVGLHAGVKMKKFPAGNGDHL